MALVAYVNFSKGFGHPFGWGHVELVGTYTAFSIFRWKSRRGCSTWALGQNKHLIAELDH